MPTILVHKSQFLTISDFIIYFWYNIIRMNMTKNNYEVELLNSPNYLIKVHTCLFNFRLLGYNVKIQNKLVNLPKFNM